MPIHSLIEQKKITPDMTPILTTAFDEAWDKFKSSGSALAEEGCAPSTRVLLAKRIIETAQKGEKDVNHLLVPVEIARPLERRSPNQFADTMQDGVIKHIRYFVALEQLAQGLGIPLLDRISQEITIRVVHNSGHWAPHWCPRHSVNRCRHVKFPTVSNPMILRAQFVPTTRWSDPPPNARRGCLPGRPVMSQPRCSPATLHRTNSMVDEAIHEHAASLPAAGHANRSRRCLIKCAKNSGHYRNRPRLVGCG